MEMGHEVRAAQIKLHEMRARERRSGGRALRAMLPMKPQGDAA
jgi:hypothetical protein